VQLGAAHVERHDLGRAEDLDDERTDIDEHPELKRWLAPYLAANPDFLNTLTVK